jgi:16S rRNA G966 N2-methylase RsmD
VELKEIELEKIILDKKAQPRASVDDYLINEYRQDMLNGDEFPPLMVFSENNHYYLGDGWHRYLAAKQLQKEKVACGVRDGGLRAAILYSCGANNDQGGRRGHGDIERSIKKLLSDAEWSQWNDYEILRQCKVSPQARAWTSFVSKEREKLSMHKCIDRKRKVKRNGKVYEMDTASIGKKKDKKESLPTTQATQQSIDLMSLPPAPLAESEQTEKEKSPKYDPINYNLFTSPISELSQHIDANSVDVIITDPPYPKEYIHCYKELAEQAAIILKPHGILVALCGHNYIDILITQMKEHLHYQWLGCYYMPTGSHASLPTYNVSVYWKPLLIFCKGKWPKKKTFKDVFVNDEADKEFHEWGQGVTGFKRLIESFTLPNETVLDPFVGGGTTAIAALESGRYFVGSDISQEEIEKTRARLL